MVNLCRAYNVTHLSIRHCYQHSYFCTVFYILIDLGLSPGALYAELATIETKCWGFFPPPGSLTLCCGPFFPLLGGKHNCPLLCTFSHIHSDGVVNLPPGICWNLWVLILRLWLLFLILRWWWLFSHWQIQILQQKSSQKCTEGINSLEKANLNSELWFLLQGGASWVRAYSFRGIWG